DEPGSDAVAGKSTRVGALLMRTRSGSRKPEFLLQRNSLWGCVAMSDGTRPIGVFRSTRQLPRKAITELRPFRFCPPGRFILPLKEQEKWRGNERSSGPASGPENPEIKL